MHNSANTLPEQTRSQSVALLNRHLAAAIDLHGQVKQVYWHAHGPAFDRVHELFDQVAGVVEEYSDKIAERAGTLGGTVDGAIQTTTQRSFPQPYRLDMANPAAQIGVVTDALTSFSDSLRHAIDEIEALGDRDTSKLFTEVARGIDYELWFVSSHQPLRGRAIPAFYRAELSRTNAERGGRISL